MILKMKNTNNGDVLIDNIEQLTRIGITRDCGDTVEVKNSDKKVGVLKKREEILYDNVSLYNLTDTSEQMHVFNLVLKNTSDNRKEYRTVLFKGPGFLMNDAGHTIENYLLIEWVNYSIY